jgi:MoaA/NifB/PqqE/SkfB family radical SAM enzyme
LESANIKILKITGGEPFSHPDINTFLKRVSQCHFKTIILTNALLLNSTQIDLIKNNNMQLGISLDGITAETYDYIRGKELLICCFQFFRRSVIKA